MFESKTVFILGAGTGIAGMPVGTRLISEISDGLRLQLNPATNSHMGDSILYDSLFWAGREQNKDYMNISRIVSTSVHLSKSIDDYIHAHNQNNDIVFCCKIAIARMILAAEERCVLRNGDSVLPGKLDVPSLLNTWLGSFFKLLHEGIIRENYETLFDNIAIINFNYDRCIEYFLYYAVMTHYSLDLQETKKLLSRLNIIHPYGTPGNLPEFSEIDAIKFGHQPSESELRSLSNRIKTYSEQIESNQNIDRAHKLLYEAEKVVCLGLAYHKQNIDLIRPASYLAKENAVNKKFYCTRKGISDADLSIVKKQLHSLWSNKEYIDSENTTKRTNTPKDHIFFAGKNEDDSTCDKLFAEYQKVLPSKDSSLLKA